MKNIKKTLTILLGLGLFQVSAQEATATSGGDATGAGGSVSYTIGQVVYSYASGANGSVSEGVQQPYEISEITGIEEAENISLDLSVYPNPTADYLTLAIEDYQSENLEFRLYDIQGRLILRNNLTSGSNTISVQHLVMATYFLTVMDGKNKIKTFKIIKQ